MEYASKKSETEQEKEKAFLEDRATLSEDEDNEDKDEESDEYSDELQFSQVGSKVDESQFNELEGEFYSMKRNYDALLADDKNKDEVIRGLRARLEDLEVGVNIL